MGAAVLQRDDVVDFLCGRVPASREAVLTQGVESGVNTKGVILNGVVKRASNAYGYGYHHYGYNYSSN